MQGLNKLRSMVPPADLVHIKGNIYRMVDHNCRGYYFYLQLPTGGYTYHQTLADAEKASRV